MLRPFRPMRSRFIRLLASMLVAGSMLCNGLAFAQAPSAPVKQHGCAEMMGQQHHGDCCDEDGQPCPAQNDNCDDQCLFRCQSVAALPSLIPPLLASDAESSALAPPSFEPGPPAVLAPALRPPISA